jgi:hypothetical protein
LRRLLPSTTLLVLLGCNSGFDPQYRVTDLRILAVRAHVNDGPGADASPGDTLHLEALVANPLGRSPLEVIWYACAPGGTGSLPPCLDPDVLRDPSSLVARAATGEGVVVLGSGARPSPVPVPDVTAALSSAVSLATSEPAYSCLLYAEIPVVVVATAGDRRDVALKRVRTTPPPATLTGTPLAGAYVINENPSVADVVASPENRDTCSGGTALASACVTSADCPGGQACAPPATASGPGVCAAQLGAGRQVLCATSTSGSSQVFNQCGPGGERAPYQEELTWQWYVTGGSFPDESGVGNATGSDPEFERPPGAFTLWLILRDGRGGEGWVRRDFEAL